MLEKMMWDLINDPDKQAKAEEMLKGSFHRMEKNHREQIVGAMHKNFEERLNREIANQMAQTLEEEGKLEFRELKEKCAAVRNLSDELLQKHLLWAVDRGYVEAVWDDGIMQHVYVCGSAENKQRGAAAK